MNVDKYKFLEHKVDVLFEAYGFKLEEAIENAAQAMFDTITDTTQLKSDEKVKIEENADSLEDLVIFVLGNLITEGDTRELFFKQFKITELKQKNGIYFLKGYAVGSEMKPEMGGTTVKAVTHHECSVKKEGNIWTIKILLDI